MEASDQRGDYLGMTYIHPTRQEVNFVRDHLDVMALRNIKKTGNPSEGPFLVVSTPAFRMMVREKLLARYKDGLGRFYKDKTWDIYVCGGAEDAWGEGLESDGRVRVGEGRG